MREISLPELKNNCGEGTLASLAPARDVIWARSACSLSPKSAGKCKTNCKSPAFNRFSASDNVVSVAFSIGGGAAARALAPLVNSRCSRWTAVGSSNSSAANRPSRNSGGNSPLSARASLPITSTFGSLSRRNCRSWNTLIPSSG
jgi:hypothetical protein